MVNPIQPIESDGTTIYNAPNVSSSNAGLAPASGGGSTNFLRADGTWTTAGGSGVSIGVNNNTVVSSGTVSLAIPSQPLVPANGIIQPLPPGNTYTSLNKYTNFTLTSSTPEAVCVGSDGNLWIADRFSAVWKVTPSGTSTKYTLTSAFPIGICSGPDGNLWVADFNGFVWKVTTAGSGTKYTLTGASPEGICSGPDGNLWVADSGLGAVWKVTTSGTPTQVASSMPNLSTICSGPDGNLWAVDQSGSVYRITTAGTATTFTFGTSNLDICSGPDGNLWIVDYDSISGGIWKCTTSGTHTKYSITGAGQPSSICAGPDGRLWAGDGVNGYIWQISTSGTLVNSFTVGGSPSFVWNCAGPDGNIWFADNSSSKIWAAYLAVTAGPRNCTSPITTVAGSTSGNMYWSMPEQGTSYKKVVIVFSSFHDAGQSITFPTAFTNTPSITCNGSGLTISTLSSSSITIPSSTSATGTICIEGS